MIAVASDTLDPAALTADTVAELLAVRLAARLAERLPASRVGPLAHYDPAMHAGLFSASRSVRDKLSQFLKLSS